MTIKDALYDIEAFIGFRDPEIKCIHVPDMEIQQVAKHTLAARPSRINMEQVCYLIISHDELTCDSIGRIECRMYLWTP